MKAEHMLDALGQIDDCYVSELCEWEEQRESRQGKHRLRFYILIAAMFILLAACAVKVAEQVWEDGWFDNFFSETHSQEAQEVLNGNQLELLDKGLVEVGQSVTCNGYTITLDSALGDGYRAFAKFTVEAPEGLAGDGCAYLIEYSTGMIPPNGEKLRETGKIAAGMTSIRLLENTDPTDHRSTLLLESLVPPTGNSTALLEQGTVWNIQITELWKEKGRGEDVTREQLAVGDWNFSVAFGEANLLSQEYEVLSKPIHIWGERSLWEHESPVNVKATSFRIRALSATMTYEKPLLGFWEGVELGKTYVVLKDGSRMEAHFKMGLNQDDYWEDTFLFEVPLAIEDIDYVEFPGGQKVYISTDTT